MNILDIEKDFGTVGVINEYLWDVYNKTVTWNIEDYDDNKLSITVPYVLIGRETAMEITSLHNPRIRNYELEQELHRYHGIQYFIKDDCPINGFSIVPKYVN